MPAHLDLVFRARHLPRSQGLQDSDTLGIRHAVPGGDRLANGQWAGEEAHQLGGQSGRGGHAARAAHGMGLNS